MEKQLWSVFYQNTCGTDVWLFWYVPTEQFPVPSLRKVVDFFKINFEPDKGEEIRLIWINNADIKFLTADQIGGKSGSDIFSEKNWGKDGNNNSGVRNQP